MPATHDGWRLTPNLMTPTVMGGVLSLFDAVVTGVVEGA